MFTIKEFTKVGLIQSNLNAVTHKYIYIIQILSVYKVGMKEVLHKEVHISLRCGRINRPECFLCKLKKFVGSNRWKDFPLVIESRQVDVFRSLDKGVFGAVL